MADLNSEPKSDSPEQPQAPDAWELMCVGVLRSDFGRRPSRALGKAMMQLSAEQAWVEGRAEARPICWRQRMREALTGISGLQLGFGAAAMFLVAALVWILMPSPQQPSVMDFSAPGCRLTDAVEARWGGSAAALKPGEMLPAGVLRLESGVVELAFATGARAAVEGPAELQLIDKNSIELRTGKISAEVPKPAVGFTVRTPNATVTDLGTRFGIDAKGENSSEVDVFEGKVHVAQGQNASSGNDWNLTQNMAMALDRRGGVTTATAPETAFPQISHALAIHPANSGFDTEGLTRVGGVPLATGFWSGPAFELTGAMGDVRPAHGTGMLRFLAPPRQPGATADSVVWQVIDLSPARDFIARYGAVDLKAWGAFNRVPGDAHTANKFCISIGAFHGDPANAAALWAAREQTAMSFGKKELVTDDNPYTWEKAEAATTITADADFAIIELRAIAPAGAAANPFPGHFADVIDAKVCVSLRSSISNLTH